MAKFAPTITDAKPALAGATGAPITNVGSGISTMPNPTLSARKEGSSNLGSVVLPAVAGSVIGSMLGGGGGGTSGQGALGQVAQAIKNAVSGSGQQQSMPTGDIGSVQKFEMPAGSTQADFDAKYGVTNGQSNVVVSGIDMGTGNVIGTVNTAIQSSTTTLPPSMGGLSLGRPAEQQTQAGSVYYQDDSGNIYDPSGNLYAVKAGNTYYVSSGSNTWTNADSGLTFSTDQLFGGLPDASINYIDTEDYFSQPDTSLWDVDYDPYADYTPSEFTSYYTPQSYSGDLSPWGQGSSDDTSYYTPIDTTWGPSWYKKGGLATPMYAKGGNVKADGVHMADGGFLDTVMGYLSGSGVQGALIGTLLSQLLSSSSSGGVNQGVDMSKVGVIQPRTTSFGMGVPAYVPYSSYGTPPPSPGTAYDQLYSDLGVSGYQPLVSPLASFGRNPLKKADGGAVSPYYTFGQVVSPEDFLANGGQPMNTNVPVLAGRKDYRQGSYVEGAGDGQSDDIPAMLADGEYVIDSEVVSALGNGSNKAGAKVLDKMRENIRKHKRSGSLNSIPPKAKSPLSYMKGAK